MKTKCDDAIEARVLPHSIEAEKAVLGAVLAFPDLLEDAMSIVRPSDFFRDAHRKLWTVIAELKARNIAIDFLTVTERLATLRQLDDVGGPAYVASLTDGIPRSAHIEHYARIVKEKAHLRGLILAANKILATAYDVGDATAAGILDSAQQELARLANAHMPSGGFVSASQLMIETMSAIQAAMERPKDRAATGVPTGFQKLDAMLGGYQRGDLIYVGARPSMGKTSLALQMGASAAAAGFPVGIFSVEMPRVALGTRLLAGEARIDTLRVRDGQIGDHEWPRLSEASCRISDLPLSVDDTPNLSLADVRVRTRKLHAEQGAAVIFIDYLQLMQTERGENRNLEIGALSRGLKIIARDLQIPIVVLSQLSRESDKRSDHRPQLSDLRDSGSLEQDADVVLFVHRPAVYGETEENRNLAEVHIGKQRNGPTGVVRLGWLNHLTRFENPNHTYPQAVSEHR